MKVILITKNDIKYKEFQKHFDLYGIEVVKSEDMNIFKKPERYLKPKETIAIFKENTFLTTGNNQEKLEINNLPNLFTCKNASTLNVKYINKSGKEIIETEYYSWIEGYLDYSKKQNNSNIFGWDDIFINKYTQQTNHEMNKFGLKMSARDLNIAKFIKERIFYDNQVETIQFMNGDTFLEQYPYLTELYESEEITGIKNILKKFTRNEVFIREAMNRREKNYWLPSLNSGLPLTKKKDKFHEETYLFHDIVHLMLPDLIVDVPYSERSRKTYIIHRLMSETFSLVIADMLFVNHFADKGLEYDFTKRKIYPLFKKVASSFDVSLFSSNGRLMTLLYGISKTFIQDDNRMREDKTRTGYEVTEEFEAFKNKYDNFAIADMWWTNKNYYQMVNNYNHIFEWKNTIKENNSDFYGMLNLLSSFMKDMPDDIQTTNEIFDYVFKNYLDRLYTLLFNDENETHNSNFFIKYMLGQCLIFTKFDFLPESNIYFENILNELSVLKLERIKLEDIKRIKNYYNQYIDILREKHLIQSEESSIYKQVYALFKPIYVNYDVEQEHTLSELVKEILND